MVFDELLELPVFFTIRLRELGGLTRKVAELGGFWNEVLGFEISADCLEMLGAGDDEKHFFLEAEIIGSGFEYF